MQERLDINNILVSSIHNERKLIIAERFTETVKTKIYKKLTANYTKSYISYLNKLVDQYNNTYHHSILLWLKKLISFLKFLCLK